MMSKTIPECPLCHRQYYTLAKHLVDRHLVLNKDERNILLRMAHGRINIRLEPCSVIGCSFHGTRLDRHLECDHPELSPEEADLSLQEVKHKTGLKMLRELREMDPPVHMITALDVEYGAHDEHPDSGAGEVDFKADEGTTNGPLRLEDLTQKEALHKELCFLRKKLKQSKASSAKRDLLSSPATPPAESITIQQPESPASSGIRSPGRTQSKDAGDEESRGEGLRTPMAAPSSVNQLDLSRRRATMPSSSRVKCKSKKKHTSPEHGAISKTARDEGQGGVGPRRNSATLRPTGRYTPGLLEAMEETAVNAIGAEVAPSDELQGDCEDSDDRDEPEMAIEVTELLAGQKQPGITAPVTQPVRINRLHDSKLNAAATRTPGLLRKTKARRAKRALGPVAGKTSPTLPRPSGSGCANPMQPITLPPSIEAVMAEYRDYNAGIDPDTKLSGDVQSKVKVYQDPSNRYYACNPGDKEALGIRHMFTDSIAQATMDAQAEAVIEAEAAGPSAPPAQSQRQSESGSGSERHPPLPQLQSQSESQSQLQSESKSERRPPLQHSLRQGELQSIVPRSAITNSLWFTIIPPVRMNPM
ncbi:uncharacterized protein [Pseudochaenichthys georgianus]|uniref:uncharacterized protein n=1 Tax=Pseudochaenichthys georgianus TaxID=52239 RepID=UPI00146A46D6|nr:uncharacterized protein LOC117441883 [Pseudochaenichthys georgianus]